MCSRDVCVKYYNTLNKYMEQIMGEKLEVKIIFSGSPNDEPHFKKNHTTKAEQDKIIKRFLQPIEEVNMMMTEIERFDKIWNRIVAHAGEIFYTKTGKEFKYYANNNTVTVSRTNHPLSKNNFKKAFELMPIESPGKINNIVRGPDYVWAILNDKRINIGQ